MKKKIKIMSTMLILLCMTIAAIRLVHEYNKKPDMTAEQVVTKLQDAGLPIDDVIVYDEQTDWNKLLGRPNQYISKVNFAEKGLEQYDLADPNGGSVEVFNNPSDLNTRKTYIDALGKGSPLFIEYTFANGNYLLRLSKDLTKDQVDKYKETFMSIK